MSAHTPGPWATVEVGDKPFVCLAVMDSDRQSLFTLVEEDGVEFAAVMEDADARLIAAAPDLLDELINLTARFKAAVMQAGTDEEFAELAVTCARAAIAKATGSQS